MIVFHGFTGLLGVAFPQSYTVPKTLLYIETWFSGVWHLACAEQPAGPERTSPTHDVKASSR